MTRLGPEFIGKLPPGAAEDLVSELDGYRLAIRDGVAVGVEILPGPGCRISGALSGKVFDIDAVPSLPLPGCRREPCCGCSYAPVLMDGSTNQGEKHMEEKTFFEHDDVKVTNTRFVNGGQTYAMSNITSVKAFEQKPSRIGGIAVLLVGLVIAVNTPMVGLLIAAAAGYYLYRQKVLYHVMLATSGGETSALTTHQKEYLQTIVAALNAAIVHRG